MCGHEWLRRLFLHERQHFTHSVSVFVSTPFTLSLAACRASGSSLASSQEVKLNCRARLPNDERLRHPGMLWARTESSEREKMLAFQLNVFFPASFFFFFWCQFFQYQGERFFFIFIYKYLHPSLGARAPRGRRVDGWSEEEEEDCKRMARDNMIVCAYVCVCVSVGRGWHSP